MDSKPVQNVEFYTKINLCNSASRWFYNKKLNNNNTELDKITTQNLKLIFLLILTL